MSSLKPLKLKKDRGSNPSQFLLKHKLIIFLVCLFGLGVLWWNSATTSSVFSFVFGSGSSLQVEQGRVNVLLLGIAGGRHEGPNLTDTIMVASYDRQSKKTTLISLPRDLWVDEHKAKVNTLYQIGLTRGDGLNFARQEIGDLLGISIPYAVRVDFGGFIKAIDLVGGVDLNVERSFDDYFYPVPGKEDDLCGYREEERETTEEESQAWGLESGQAKVLVDLEGKVATAAAAGSNLVFTDQQVFDFFACRFEHLRFEAGRMHMDGETALKFVRSRHGTNSEGTDFARSKRQQQLLQSFREKVLSLGTLSDLSKVKVLVETLGESIETNIPVTGYGELVKLIKQSEGTTSLVIDSGGDNPLLITPPLGEYGSWVLIPPDNDFTRIHQYVGDILTGKINASGSASVKK